MRRAREFDSSIRFRGSQITYYYTALYLTSARHVVQEAFNALERRAAWSIALVFLMRMFGLFLLLPVMAIHAQSLPGATPLLIGLAVGVYGLTQAALQIPFGMISDRIGRKPMMTVGLLCFFIGSVLTAIADSMAAVIAGRAIQGAGAIAAVGLALATDLTRESQRTKMMAILGISVGASFVLALIVAPLLQGLIGLRGLFWVVAALALGALIVVWTLVPTSPAQRLRRIKSPHSLVDALVFGKLWLLHIVIFVLHMIMTLVFVVVPVVLVTDLSLAIHEHWRVYLPATLISVIFMVPLLRLSKRPGQLKPAMLISLAASATGLMTVVGIAPSVWLVGIGLTLFFAGFNALEALLPSLVSRVAPAEIKGAALGVFSSSSFMGAFVGGSMGGYVAGAYGLDVAFLLALGVIGLLILFIYLSDTMPVTRAAG